MTGINIGQTSYKACLCRSSESFHRVEGDKKDVCTSQDKSTHESEIHSSSIIPNVIARIFCKISKMSNTATLMSNIFSPFVDMVNSLAFGNNEPQTQESNKKTVKDFTAVLCGIEDRIKNNPDLSKRLTKESRAALEKFYSTVSKLNQRKDLQNMDISQLIAKWRRDPNSAALLQMAQNIRQGQCHHFTNRRLREVFIRSLESLGTALERLENQPQSTEAQQGIQEIQQAANPIVDNVEIHQQREGDANYTEEDRHRMYENFRTSRDCILRITNDPNLSQHTNELQEFVSYLSEFIEYLFNEIEESRREEEQRQLKIQCEERCRQMEEIRKLCEKHKAKKTKSDLLYLLMNAAKKKMFNFIRNKYLEKNHSGYNNYKLGYTTEQEEKHVFKYEAYRNEYRNERILEDFYKDKEQEIQLDLMPSYVCEHEPVTKIDFDLTC